MTAAKPLLLDFPDQLETEHLLIRAPRPGDGVAVHEAVMETLDTLRRWMPWALQEQTVDVLEEFVRRGAASFITRTELPLLLWLKDDETFVGASGLQRIDWSVPRLEIGYWCRARFEGQGYISEAVCEISRFAFEHLNARRIEIRCDALNERSARVAIRCGFQLEGQLRDHELDTAGQLRDTLIFSLLASDDYAGSFARADEGER